MYNSLYELATRSTPPPVNPTYCQNRDIDLPTTTDLSFLQRSSSCIQRLDRPQLPAMIVQLHSTTQLISASCNDRPAAFNNSTNLSFLQRSSSCILRLDRPEMAATIIQLYPTTRPTSASCNDRPAAFNDSTDSYQHQTSGCISTTRPTPVTLIEHPAAHIYDSTIPAIDITHLAEDPNTTATDFTHALVNTTINGYLCCICSSPLFPSLSLAVITRTH